MIKKYRVSIGNEKLAFLDEGQGEVVLMVHGNMSSSVHYKPLIDRIKHKYRCIAVDLRGFGDSTYNNRFDTLDELAEDKNGVIFVSHADCMKDVELLNSIFKTK